MIKKSGGFTLVEVMVTVGILAVALYTLATLATDLEKAPAYSEAQVSVGAISNVIRETLKYQSTCQSSLNGITVDPITNEIQMKIPGILNSATPANDVLQAGVTLQKIKITGLHFVNTVNLSPGKYFSEVQLDSQMVTNGMQLRPWIAGAVFYSMNGSNQITSCNSRTADPVSLCQEMGCTWNPTQSPACQCTPIDLSCPAQQFLTGYDPSLTPSKICTGLGNGQCPAGTYLRGIFIGGNDCVPLSAIASTTTAVNGACGTPPNGGTYPDSASANTAGTLCTSGTSSVSSLSGAGPWSWTCNGANGGTTASCAASVSAAPVVSCGTALGTPGWTVIGAGTSPITMATYPDPRFQIPWSNFTNGSNSGPAWYGGAGQSSMTMSQDVSGNWVPVYATQGSSSISSQSQFPIGSGNNVCTSAINGKLGFFAAAMTPGGASSHQEWTQCNCP